MSLLDPVKTLKQMENLKGVLFGATTIPIVMLMREQEAQVPQNIPFYVYLGIHDFVLHNCMIDTREGHNIMPSSIMKKLGLECIETFELVLAMGSHLGKMIGEI